MLTQPVGINSNHVVGVVGIGVAAAKDAGFFVCVDPQRIVDVFDGVVFECGEHACPTQFNAVAQSAVDETVLHGKFAIIPYHVIFVGTAIDELNILELVVVAVGVDADATPCTRIVVVERVDEADGFFGRTDHFQSSVFAHVQAAVNAGEHDGHAGFDGEKGVAFDVGPAVDDVVHIQSAVGPSGVGINAAGPSGRVVGVNAANGNCCLVNHRGAVLGGHSEINRIGEVNHSA